MNLSYKGMRSSRVKVGGVGFIAVTLAYSFGDVTAAQYVDFIKWIVGIYAVSEVGTKAAVAHKERGND